MEHTLASDSTATTQLTRSGTATDLAPESSLARGLRVLTHLALAGRPLGVTELAHHFGVPKSNMHRHLNTLVGQGFASRLAGGRYRASLKLWQLGLATYNSLGIVRLARPALDDLVEASEETVHLSVLDKGDVLYVDKIDSPQPVRAYSRLGGRAPAHCVATGKALLAHLDPTRLDALVGNGLARHSSQTITDAGTFEAHLAQIRAAGFAVNRGEWREDVYGLAAPIRDAAGSIVAAVGISGPKQRLGERRLKQLTPFVKQAARRIEAALVGQELTA